MKLCNVHYALFFFMAATALVFAQDYQDSYQDFAQDEDNLYHNYAQHQAEKGAGG